MYVGNITIRTNPPGAVVYVNSMLATDAAGNPMTTPMTLTLPVGMQRFEMVLSGYYEDWDHIYIYCDSDIQLDRTLMEIPMPIGQMPNYEFV